MKLYSEYSVQCAALAAALISGAASLAIGIVLGRWLF